MIYSTLGIVLSYTEYSETSIIVTIYTEEFGRQSYLINKVKTTKSKFKAGYFQPLVLLDLQVYHHPKKNIQRIKELLCINPFHSIPFEINKSSVAFFIAEILYLTIKEEESNPLLFKFLFNSIILLDEIKTGIQNFHLLFLLQLTKYLGFYPRDNYNSINKFFNLRLGEFVSYKNQNWIINEEESKSFFLLLDESQGNNQIKYLDHLNRYEMIKKIIEYYRFHNYLEGNLKSLEILKQIYH